MAVTGVRCALGPGLLTNYGRLVARPFDETLHGILVEVAQTAPQCALGACGSLPG
jgi:hypothetical protein